MDLFYIILLVFFGLLFLVAELVLLPGVSIGAILSLVCYGGSIYLAFRDFGTAAGVAVIVVILLLSVAAVVVSLRAKTWQRFSLRQEIRSSSSVLPAEELRVGQRGVTLSRLSPMGKVEIDGKVYEAKSTGAYVDPRQEIEVVGFENFSVIVKTFK
ncbi:MAG TPA: NfeD family protein [Candidatus Alistipes intestinigallinarum]|uniref:NfeD family protein n=1 Tax=Candidatus Alistipes intestinigallinarum TaxID=2838440 RepID=A0A9D2CC17_9BACT|nr:NfeD family protein [Candidatus Alistipes intestinigallinarum]